ncbi:mediator of RNA polymerase II transcription subunit 6, partial [Tremellales sp. Uapishka_1]
MDYFAYSPFWDNKSNNNVLRTQRRVENPTYGHADERSELNAFTTGFEYIIAHSQPPNLFIVHKREVEGDQRKRVLAIYFILMDKIYPTPSIYDVMSSRLKNAAYLISNTFTKLSALHPPANPRMTSQWRSLPPTTDSSGQPKEVDTVDMEKKERKVAAQPDWHLYHALESTKASLSQLDEMAQTPLGKVENEENRIPLKRTMQGMGAGSGGTGGSVRLGQGGVRDRTHSVSVSGYGAGSPLTRLTLLTRWPGDHETISRPHSGLARSGAGPRESRDSLPANVYVMSGFLDACRPAVQFAECIGRVCGSGIWTESRRAGSHWSRRECAAGGSARRNGTASTTLFTTTSTATFTAYSSATYLCNSLFPATLTEPYFPDNVTYCPLPAGPFAINLSIPLRHSYDLTTLHTQVRIVDTSVPALTLTCIDVHFTPYHEDAWYYRLFLWAPVAIAIGYWATTWAARFAAGWVVGSGVAEYGQKGEAMGAETRVTKRDARMRKWATMFVSGLSGERLGVSGGLLRFVTPGLRDVVIHIQWCTMLAMVAVSWPAFAYPIFAQGAWTDLVWNTTLVQGVDPASKRLSLSPSNYSAPSAFAQQMNDPFYPLYLDTSTSNPLLDLHDSAAGIPSFATAVGLRNIDLFGTCLAIFLMLTAGVVVLSLLLWFLHGLWEFASGDNGPKREPQSKRSSTGTSPRTSHGGGSPRKEEDAFDDPIPFPSRSSMPSKLRRTWLRFRLKGEAGAFHSSTLFGNLLRLIILFHMPITTFSIYQLTLSEASLASRILAAFAFAFIAVIIPAVIMVRIYLTPTGKLYDATRTLLSLGPMYNVYEQEKQMFRIIPLLASLVTGIVVGAGEANGMVQAILLILVELVVLIIPVIWFPWGDGASMALPSAFLSILRLVSLVLVMVLSPTMGLQESTLDWLAYGVLIIQAIIFIFFLLVLLSKIVEGIIRIVGGVHFDESTHPLDGGFFAAIASLDCLNGDRGGTAAARRRRKRGSRQLQRNVSAAGSLTTQMMLDRHSQGIQRPPVSEGTTPFLAGFPDAQVVGQGSYFAPLHSGYEPTRVPSDERSDGHIMEAWRPPSIPGSASGYAPVGSRVPSATSPTSSQGPNRSFSVIRGGRADFENPYTVKEQFGGPPPPSIRVSQSDIPPHSKQKSHSAMVEMFDQSPNAMVPTLGLTYPPGQPRMGMRANTHGLRPPQLSIPKKRSLNTLTPAELDKDSPSSDSDGERKGKRHWFVRNQSSSQTQDSTEESEDEPPVGQRRRRKGKRKESPLVVDDDVDEEAGEKKGRSRGWKVGLGLGSSRKKSLDDFEERLKDENKARKAAVVAESGALFAGVDAPSPSPSKGFVVTRKNGAETPPTPARSFVVKRPLAPTPPPEPESSFKVKRAGQKTPAIIEVEPSSPARSFAVDPSDQAPSPTEPTPVRSFKVIRPSIPADARSFRVNRQGPPSAYYSNVMTTTTPTTAEMTRVTSGESDSSIPSRPPKNPRRASMESTR